MSSIASEIPRWAWELGFFLYLATGIAYVVLERRHPRTTLVWVLAIVWMPVLGLLLYFTFGRRPHRRYLKKERETHRATRLAAWQRAHPEALPAELDPVQRGLVRLALESGPTPLRRARDVRLVPADEHARHLLLDAIADSRERVWLEFYIWRDDEAGRAVTAALVERARAGVDVRVLYDHLGSFGLPRAHFEGLRAAGGRIRVFSPILTASLRTPRANFRNHRKIATFDGRVGVLGGANIANEYLGVGRAAEEWEDLVVRLEGPAVGGLEAIFLRDWVDAGDEDGADDDAAIALIEARELEPAHAETLAGDGPLVQMIPSGPDAKIAGAIAGQFTVAIASALERCWIATPYLIPDDALRLALTSAARKGVDVRLLVPGVGDSRWVRWASLSYYDELLEAGCRISEAPHMIHSKYLIVDRRVSAIGSANMDIRSFYLNYEITAMFYDEGVNAALAEQFERDHADARGVSLEARARLGWRARALEALARVTSPIL